jgi:endonuclease YncB( thermonuclease family)
MQHLARVALTLGVLAALPATAAEQLVGRARVLDGDTIVVAGVHVQLQGVAAPGVAHPGQPHDEPGGMSAGS